LAFGKNSLLTWLRKQVGRRASAVVANSHTGAGYWRSVLPKNTILKTISNAMDLAAIRSVAPVSLELTQNDQKIVLVVGRLSHQKAVEVVLKAISLLTERGGIRFVVMGEGPQRRELEELIETLEIGDSVVMLPFQSGWWGWLKSAAALVSMSRFEGNPNVVLEAMAAGCPLIVSDIPEHREILTDASASFVPGENSIELAASILKLLADPNSARERAESAKSYVDGLTIQRAAAAYEEVYASVSRGKEML
jgi:glycosyltransferase involved in cell wall biosynthesis